MDLNPTPEAAAFRHEVRDFLRRALAPDLTALIARGASPSRAQWLGWQAVLHRQGWAAPNWPRHFGGAGWTALQRHIFDEECSMANAPRLLPFGIVMLGPVLQHFGTPAQQAQYLPRILDGTDWWAQGYSEPGAGSDLAALATRAVRDGDDYIVNGQKTWTSLAQHANRIFCLVRTATTGRRQAGISFLLCDLDAPGVEVRPIRLIEGGHEVNEVFFTDVRVPAENLVGAENQGWAIAKFLLGHERTGIAGIGLSMRALADLKQIAATVPRGGRPLADDPLFAARIALAEAELEALRITNMRMLMQAERQGNVGTEASILKIQGSTLRQTLLELQREALGIGALALPDEDLEAPGIRLLAGVAGLAGRAFNNRKLSIFGGSNEIQREIVARELLGF